MARNFHIDYGAKGGPALIDGDTGLEVGVEPERFNDKILKRGKYEPKNKKLNVKEFVRSEDPIKRNKAFASSALIKTPFLPDTKDGIDHFVRTAKLDYPDDIKKQKELDDLGVKMKKSAMDDHYKQLKNFDRLNPKTYPSNPKQRGHLIEADKLEVDLQIEKEKGRKFTTGKERSHFNYFSKYGEMLTPTKEEIRKTKGPDSWKIIYDSMTPYEKGQWNLEQRKRGMNGKTAEPLKKEEPKAAPAYSYKIDSSVFDDLENRVVERRDTYSDKLNKLLLDSAMRKIDEANSGIGGINPRRIAAMNSGGPVDDGPPTLDQYLKLGMQLANLTDAERAVVKDLLDRTLYRTKDEK